MKKFRRLVSVFVASAAIATLAATPAEAATSLVDTTSANFNLGTKDNTVVTTTGGGQVSVSSLADTSFTGSALPDGWTEDKWTPSGTTAVGSNKVVVNGTKVGTNTNYTPGQSAEAYAKLSGHEYQFVGLGQLLNGDPAAGFHTLGGGTLHAYAGGSSYIAIAGSWFGAFHTYRVEWKYDRAEFYINNILRTTLPITPAQVMRPVASDVIVDGGSVEVDWFKLTSSPDVSTHNFSGSTIPSGWRAEPYVSGGYSTGNSTTGKITNESSRVFTDNGYNAGVRVDITARFTGGESQFVGLGVTGDSESLPTFNTYFGGALYAMVNGSTYQQIPGDWFTKSHVFRIDWKPTVANYYIDGVLKASLPVPAGVIYRPMAGDGVSDGLTLELDAYTMQPLTESPSAEFSGPIVPSGWYSENWIPQGSATFTNGAAELESSRVGAQTMYTAGVRADIRAKFGGGESQYVGFGSIAMSESLPGFDTYLGGELYAYSDGYTRQLIPGDWIGEYHDFRVDWKATQIDFYIDNVLKASMPTTSNFVGRPIISDGHQDGSTLIVDHFRTSSLTAPGSFTSRVFDSGAASEWGTMSWNGTVPATARMNGFYRSGPTPVPDATWSTFQPVSSGNSLATPGRYAQYKFDLQRSVGNKSTFLNDVVLTFPRIYTDTTDADFALGSQLDTQVLNTSGGEVGLAPTALQGTFTSRVIDGSVGASWSRVTWNADLPGDSSLVLRYRVGGTAVPDATWSGLVTATSGTPINVAGRYLQYEAVLTAGTVGEQPVLRDIQVRA